MSGYVIGSEKGLNKALLSPFNLIGPSSLHLYVVTLLDCSIHSLVIGDVE